MSRVKRTIREASSFYLWLSCTLIPAAFFYHRVPFLGEKLAWAVILIVSFISFCFLGMFIAGALESWAND